MNTKTNIHRARMYKLLAIGFDKPHSNSEDLAVSDETFGHQLVESAAAFDANLARNAMAVVRNQPSSDETHRAMYRSTFGVEHESAISRYEVSYAPGTLVTNTDRLADIAGFYRAFGLETAESAQERVDYLPTQLEFMQHLALQRAYLHNIDDTDGVEIVQSATKGFIEDHLGRWIPRFVEEVHDDSTDRFYSAFAEVLRLWVRSESNRFSIDPDVFDTDPRAPLADIMGLERDEFGRLTMQCGFDSTSSGVNHQ